MPRFCCLDEPFDNVGHGSHVMGSIVGSTESGTGVAPGARWIAAKGCRDGNCLRYGLAKSAQWVICPTRINGTDADCSRGADIVSNSWGGKDPRDDFYTKYVHAWRQAGLVPVFANGNVGPECGAISAPGDFANVMGIGAINVDNQLASFSSRGPAPQNKGRDGGGDGPVFGDLKPDFVAPGVKVVSADARTNDTYMTMSGTSMATPHAAGVLALVLSALDKRHAAFRLQVKAVQDGGVASTNEEMYSRLYDILKATTTHEVEAPIGGGGRRVPLPGWPERQQCDGRGYSTWPNMFYGYGVLDAHAAVSAAIESI